MNKIRQIFGWGILIVLLFLLMGCPSISVPPEQVAIGEDHYQKAMESFLRGQYQAADYQFDRFLDSYPRSSLTSEARYFSGLSALKVGKEEKAIRMLNNAKHVSDETWYFSLGVALIRSGHWPEGNAKLKELVRRYPRSLEAQRAAELFALLENQHYVQVGYFKNKKNADAWVMKCRSWDRTARRREVMGSDGLAHFVLIGPYATWSETVQKATSLVQNGTSAIALP